MVAYRPTSNDLIFTSSICICSSCLNGDFEKCQNHQHEIVFGKIATNANARSRKADSKCRDEYIHEKSDFFQHVNEWDKQWIESDGDDDLSDIHFSPNNLSQSPPQGAAAQGAAAQGAAAQRTAAQGTAAQGTAGQDDEAQEGEAQGATAQGSAAQDGTAQDGAAQDDPAQTGPARDGSAQYGQAKDGQAQEHEIVDSPPEFIQDDQEYWSRKADFHYHLALLFSIFRNSDQMNLFLNSLETYDKLNLDELREVWDCINEDRSFEGDFDMGCIDQILIKRHYLQECGANEWFNIEMINVAFKNIQFRSKNKVIALKAEVMHEIEV